MNCRPIAAATLVLSALLAATDAGAKCAPPQIVTEATAEEVRAAFAADGRMVVTFIGYSGAGYEDPAAMRAQAGRVLDRLDPKRTLVNIGATAEGIGAVYELAKQRGFATSGIVSSQARHSGTPLSPCVDRVYFVADDRWGGFLPGTRELSPTSAAMVGVSTRLVAIGGGEVARDELLAAKTLGKRVDFIAADMNHRVAVKRAASRGEPFPGDFRGAADAAMRKPS